MVLLLLLFYYNGFSVDIKKAPAVVYLSLVCRHNLATNGCKSQVVDYYFSQLQDPFLQMLRGVGQIQRTVQRLPLSLLEHVDIS